MLFVWRINLYNCKHIRHVFCEVMLIRNVLKQSLKLPRLLHHIVWGFFIL